MAGNPNHRNFPQHAFGAHFAEVGVDVDTGEIRVRRMLGVFAAGKVLNPRTARWQLIGGMIWGVSAALQEEAVVDPRFGQLVNRGLAGYNGRVGDQPFSTALTEKRHDPLRGAAKTASPGDPSGLALGPPPRAAPGGLHDRSELAQPP